MIDLDQLAKQFVPAFDELNPDALCRFMAFKARDPAYVVLVLERGDLDVYEAWGELHERCVLSTNVVDDTDDAATVLRLLGVAEK